MASIDSDPGARERERELIEQVVADSRMAFDRLVGPHIPALLRLAGRMLGTPHSAEDAVQSALASVWMARHRLDPARPIAPFLTTATLNKCRDRLRRRRVARLLGLEQETNDAIDASDAPDPEAQVGNAMALQAARAEIERLPMKLREALVLVAIEGFSHKEAASLIGVTAKTIETRLYRARKRLRGRLQIF